MSKFPPFTPTADKDNFAGQGDTFLPPELCLDCIHGYKVLIGHVLLCHELPCSFVGLICLILKLDAVRICHEAACHLQEFKDNLIVTNV
jgi:hypothetical protein